MIEYDTMHRPTSIMTCHSKKGKGAIIISETRKAMPTKNVLQTFYINLYLYNFFELILID